MSSSRLSLSSRLKWFAGAGLLLLLALACQVSLGPQGVIVNTAATAAPAAPGSNALGATAAPPFDFTGAPPIVRPDLAPRTVTGQTATATPGANTGNQGSTARGPVVASEIWDFPTGAYTQAQGGIYYAAGGDVYAFNLYERPFAEQTQDHFYPDLDIRYARLVRMGDWFFVALRLHGLAQGADAPTGDYGVELDTDLDGRGEYLVWAQGPVPTAWTPKAVQVFQDQRPDVEGPRTCTSDAPLQGDGYERVRYTADATTGLAWQMWGWESEGRQRYPTVYIAFHRSLLDGQDEQMLWQAWADGGLRAPGQMTYHDRYTRAQAGSPYRGDPDFPIRSVARVDNTCRAAFGFEPTGVEPCLCESSTTVQLCPAPQEPPAPGCYPDGPNTWSCPFQAFTGAGVTAAPQGEQFYCVWDAELCRWSCRTERICLPPGKDEAGAWLRPLFPPGNPGAPEGDPDTLLPAYCYFAPRPECTQSLNPGGPVLPNPPTPPVGPVMPPPPTPPSGADSADVPTLPTDLGPGGLTVRQGENSRVCVWDENLCRWQCRDETCVLPDPGPNCQPQADGTYKCTTEGEISLTYICRADQETCRWDCRPEGQVCPAPSDGPSAGCQDLGDGRWSCASEIGAFVCTWDEEQCEWGCETDQCTVPNQDCAFDEATERWICPGKGEFAGCEWSADACRWKCWDPIRPKPQPGDEPGQCQSEDFCSLDGDLWYCHDGGIYSSCQYDGCVWSCD